MVALSGVVSNCAELRSELRQRGRRLDGSDLELAVVGYLEWGDALAEKLAGAYGLAVWDGRNGRLVLVRDRLGVEPLFWSDADGGMVFASTETAMLAHPEVEPVVTLDGLRFLFGHDRTPGTGLWDRMTEVVPGAMLIADKHRREVRQYWELTPDSHDDDGSVVTERVVELLTSSGIGCLPDTPELGVLLGGLDSSVLAALARDTMIGPGGGGAVGSRLLGLTLDDWSPDGDPAYAAQVAAALGLDYRTVRLDADQLADPRVRDRVLRARAMPMGAGDLDFSLLLLLDTAAENAPVWWSGEGADAVFAGGRMYDHHSTDVQATFPWLVGMERVTAERDLFTPGFAAALNLEEYVADQYRSAVAEIEPIPNESTADTALRRVQHLVLTRFLRQLLDRTDRVGWAAGVRVRVPYCDHRLIEYLYNASWDVKRPPDGPSKRLLRDSFGHQVPRGMLNRHKMPYPLVATPAYARLLQRQAAEVLAQRAHPVWVVFDRDRVRALAEARFDTVEVRHCRVLERVVDMALWFDTYAPLIEP